MKEKIAAKAVALGFDFCGFASAAAPNHGPHFSSWLASGRHGEMGYLQRNAPKRMDPQLVLPGAKSVVVLAASYLQPENQSSPSRANGIVARYARGADYHDVLGNRLEQLSRTISDIGGPAVRSLWYVDTGPILEREFAERAGIGFIGKHTNVISRRAGNWIFLSEILTTLELEPDVPEHNRCGSCSRCLEACPTGAITAPFQLDARRCISYLTIELKGSIPVELRPAIGNRIYGCDDCLAACPWNRFAVEGRLMSATARPDLAQLPLLDLLELDETGFRQMFGGTPILRAKRRGFLRNVCVALGNTGDVTALPALRKAAQDSEPLIAEHAAWAVNQIEGRARDSELAKEE